MDIAQEVLHYLITYQPEIKVKPASSERMLRAEATMVSDPNGAMVELREVRQRMQVVQQRMDKLQAFKTFVHKTLDDHGVPEDPPGEHRDAGCRIGQRLELVLKDFHPRFGIPSDTHITLSQIRAIRKHVLMLRNKLVPQAIGEPYDCPAQGFTYTMSNTPKPGDKFTSMVVGTAPGNWNSPMPPSRLQDYVWMPDEEARQLADALVLLSGDPNAV